MRDKALKSVSETFEDVLNILMLNSIKIIKWLFLIYGYEDYMILKYNVCIYWDEYFKNLWKNKIVRHIEDILKTCTLEMVFNRWVIREYLILIREYLIYGLSSIEETDNL